MKKIASLFFVLSLLVGMFALPVHAEEPSGKIDTIVHEHWTDEEGNPLSEELVELLTKAVPVQTRGIFCCSPYTMDKVTVTTENHAPTYSVPTCHVSYWRYVICSHCFATWSITVTNDYYHNHF